MRKFAKNDHENDECGYPRPKFIGMNNLVPEQCDKEGADGNYENPGPSRDIRVDRIDELRANDNIDRRPPNTSQNVEKSDCAMSVEDFSKDLGTY